MTVSATTPARLLVAALAAAPFLAMAPGAARAQDQGECQGEPSDAKLRVVVEGVRNAKGEMTATLYGADPARFLKSKG